MKAYGVKVKDAGCCPFHDKFPGDSYGNRRSKKAHGKARHSAHSRARAVARAVARREIKAEEN